MSNDLVYVTVRTDQSELRSENQIDKTQTGKLPEKEVEEIQSDILLEKQILVEQNPITGCLEPKVTLSTLRKIIFSLIKQSFMLFIPGSSTAVYEEAQWSILIGESMLKVTPTLDLELRTIFSVDEYVKSTNTAVAEAYTQVLDRDCVDLYSETHRCMREMENELLIPPSFVFFVSRSGMNGMDITRSMEDHYPNVPFVSISSHTLITSMGVSFGTNIDSDITILSAFAVRDITGAFGVGVSKVSDPSNEGIRAAGVRAANHARAAAARPRESPNCLLVISEPGNEEMVLEGVKDVFGDSTFILGGSAADDAENKGVWWVGGPGHCGSDVIAVLALYTTLPCVKTFDYSFKPSFVGGTVTAMDGNRHILTIDDRPAGIVYSEWLGRALDHHVEKARETGEAQSVELEQICTLNPFGKLQIGFNYQTDYIVVHPHLITPELGLTCFCNVDVGEQVMLMPSTRRRIDKKVRALNNVLKKIPSSGALFFFCSGLAGVLGRERLSSIMMQFRETLQNSPFLMYFANGENGSFSNLNTMNESELGLMETANIASHTVASTLESDIVCSIENTEEKFVSVHACLSIAMLSFGSPVCHIAMDKVAFVCTDIKGSTYLWNGIESSVMNKSLSLHNKIMRHASTLFKGYEVGTAGDSFTICFSTVREAVGFSIYIQIQFLIAEWPPLLLEDNLCMPREEDGVLIWRGLPIRIGIHTGETKFKLNPTSNRLSYYGRTLKMTELVSECADGGEIYLSENAMQELDISDTDIYGGAVLQSVGRKFLNGSTTELYCLMPKCLSGRFDVRCPVTSYKLMDEEFESDCIASARTLPKAGSLSPRNIGGLVDRKLSLEVMDADEYSGQTSPEIDSLKVKRIGEPLVPIGTKDSFVFEIDEEFVFGREL
ncbi:hypothetical protein PCE1_002588 [Barthelona sp. PCE]